MGPMRKMVAIATVGALAFAGVATAHDDHGAKSAKVYRAKLVKTAAADTAALPDITGKAQLVDGKKNNKISIHVRGLKPGESYPWHIHKAKNDTDDPCAPGTPAADPTPYPGWTYGTLTANDAGNASAKGTSTTFADTGPFYVNVHLADGTVIACGVLKPNKAKKSHGKNGHANQQPEPRTGRDGSEQGQGHAPGHGRDDD